MRGLSPPGRVTQAGGRRFSTSCASEAKPQAAARPPINPTRRQPARARLPCRGDGGRIVRHRPARRVAAGRLGDVGAFVESLAAKLEEALPGRVKVQRGRRGMFGPKIVRSVVVDCGGERLELMPRRGRRDRDAAVRGCRAGSCSRASRSTPTTGSRRSAQALAAEAQRSEQTRQALERLLID